MLRKLTSLGILVVASVFVPSCSAKECTLIGCASGLTIEFTGGNATPGRYRVEMVADEQPMSCEITLPSDGREAECSAGQPIWNIRILPDKTDGIERLAQIVFYSATPKSVAFTVHRDDKIVGGDMLQPTYVESFPNGPECGPACRQAQVQVALDP
jgi:hypothetical protein